MATLHNLDDLLLTVRDPQSRTYLEEVVNAHRAGANRAAMVTLWTTIVYDLIQKIRELANSGDANAIAFVREYEDAVERADLRRLLQIEEEIIDTAQKGFEMLQPHEATALSRIRADRHLCAHPAMTITDILFQPMPDLVQAYVVNAVTYLLALQPMQGKSALERIYSDIASPSFPVDIEPATRYLGDRYLKRAKPALIRNLTIVLLKKHVGQSAESDIDAFSLALDACLRTRRSECAATLQEQLPRLVVTTDVQRLINVLAVVDIEPQCWEWCEEPTRILIREILKKGEQHTKYTPRILRGASHIEELATLVTVGYEQLDEAQKLRLAELTPRKEFIKPAIARLAGAFSFRAAGSIGEHAIVPLAPLMTADEVIDVLQAVQGNGQVYMAAEIPDVLASVFEATRRHLSATFDVWKSFVDQRRSAQQDTNDFYAYPVLAEKLEAYRPGSMTVIPTQ
jgi:hypothetical protein